MQEARDLMEGRMEIATNPQDLIYSLMNTEDIQALISDMKNSKAKVRELAKNPKTNEQMMVQEEYQIYLLYNYLINLTNWIETR